MNPLNSIGPRQYQNTSTSPATSQAESKPSRANAVRDVNADSAVSLSSNAVDLQKRVDQLGNRTVDMAQDLIGSFAKSLLGDNAKGAKISFDSVALESNASFAAGALHAEGADGVTDAFGFSLSENSHFLGKGTITTADGRKLSFEVEIQYEATMSAGAASSVPGRRQDQAGQNPAMPLPEVEFPDIDFPGSLADLFRLMDRNISATLKQQDEQGQESDAGNLTMRLLKLVDSESSLDTYLPANASEKAKAYGRLQSEPGQAAELAHAAKAARDGEIDPPSEETDPAATDIAPPAPAIAPAPEEPPAA
ncbi:MULTISPECIES: hypothetical protein [unclassified Duganella]|uniref:hypothetical protein n=1 Tax=unclassified Duganella TaxID=2636909 RepID=UPI0007011BCA|nr:MULTISPECIES: hypothetical protein [unclassified Duganella]KQV46103.1 hypothetical protein ASD07_16675 [Duganella sp. Root336D2]KRB81770.1 hypothetical protein ASE26_15720 [Duganella sp. Root198D2]